MHYYLNCFFPHITDKDSYTLHMNWTVYALNIAIMQIKVFIATTVVQIR